MQIARDAGSVLMQRLGAAKVTNKSDIDLVTEADIASEQLIIERIRSYYPQHAILAEESGETVVIDWGLAKDLAAETERKNPAKPS